MIFLVLTPLLPLPPLKTFVSAKREVEVIEVISWCWCCHKTLNTGVCCHKILTQQYFTNTEESIKVKNYFL